MSVFAVLGPPGSVSAQPADAGDPVDFPEEGESQEDTARSHFRVGELLYGEGRFNEAAAEFDRAYELSGRPALLYNAYLAHRDAGRLRDAVDRLSQYLREMPEAPNRETLEQRLAAMQETLAQQEAVAQMSEEERAALETERQRAAEEAERNRLEAEAARAARERSEARRNPAPWIVLGAGAAMLVGGAVTGVITKTRLDELDRNCRQNQVCDSGFPLDARRDEARRTVIATDALLFAGTATALTGVVLLVVQRRRYAPAGSEEVAAERRSRPTVSGGCSTTGCSVGLAGSF